MCSYFRFAYRGQKRAPRYDLLLEIDLQCECGFLSEADGLFIVSAMPDWRGALEDTLRG